MSASFTRAINVLREQVDASVASFFSACTHCGLCSEACLFYTETGDPNYIPIYKLEPFRHLYEQDFTLAGRVKHIFGLSPELTDVALAQWSELVYDSCTLCGRCAMVCPVGNNPGAMVRKLREGMSVAGYAPDSLVDATQRNVHLGSAMGVSYKTLKAQLIHLETDIGLTVPVDVQGADYMLLLSSMEIVQFPEFISAVTRIFHQAGVSWTISSTAFEASNSGIQIGASDIAQQIVERTIKGAQALGVKTVITPECGHSYTALRWEGPTLMGKPLPFKVRHILEVVDQLHQQGRIHFDPNTKDTRPLTYHDPCQIARQGGVIEAPRRLLNAVASDFREMAAHGKMNWCCGGGGGVSAIERADPLRSTVFKKKKQQIEEVGVHTVVSACSNCRMMLEQGIEDNSMDVEVISLTELVADHLVSVEQTVRDVA
ncbi:MAG: (Fe-S)-binding protein [Magnetococcales bacterium]|nr:(Fe-S)-binding protein [Magnetococcales bacterium]